MNTIKDIFFALIDTIKKHNFNVGKVKFVKLLYLLEWRYARLNNARLTDLEWKFWHYGPYPMVNAKRSQDLKFFISHPHLHYAKPQAVLISKETKKRIKELIKSLNNKIENDKVPGPPPIVDEYLQQALLQMDTLND